MMSDAPQVSIVVPVRRAVGTIRSTLESLLVQTSDFKFEVIVVIAESPQSSESPSLVRLALRDQPPDHISPA